MKRILHVIHSLTGGGAAREMIYLARYSEDSEGYHHVVATLRPSTEGGLALARDYDLSVIETPPNDRLRREIEKADIVQVNWWNNPEITAFLHSHMPDSRLVIRYHVSGDKPPHCIVREHLEMADANVISYRDLPLLSGFSESWKRDRVSFILHGTDFKRLGNIGPRTHHTFNVGYIGTVSFVKMHPDYVPMSDAIDIPEVRFVICGEVQDKSLMRQVLHRKADHKFDFKGYVNDIAEIVAEMDVFGYPLCEDTYASTDLVLQEVMYAGIPAVVFPHGGLLQTVKDGHNGIVVSTAEQYKEAIEFLYANPAERDRLGKNAKAYVERHLGIENTVNQYHGIYRKLLEQPKVHHAWGKDHDTPLLQQSMAYQDITGDWPQESAAQLFLDSLGQHAGAFEQSMHCERLATCFEADTELSQSSDLLFLDGILKYRAFDPHDPYLNYWAGLVFKDRQSPNQAITCWMNAHGQGFGHWRLYLYLANALQAVGKKGDGRKIWEYLLKIRPDFEKEVEAIAPQKLALEGPPKAPLTHAGHCQRPDKARGNGNSGTHPTPPEEMYQALQPLIIEGKEEELARGLEALLELYPSFALAHNDLGVLSLNRGEKERALRHYEKAVGIEPENMVFQKNLAELYSFGLGRVEEAVQIYKKILASHPEDVETLLAMGHICKAVNHLKDALFFYEKAMEVSEEMRNSREAVLNLGSICTSLEEREKARQVYLSLLSKNMEDEAVILAWESLKDREEDKEIEELVTAEKRDYLVSAIVSTYNSEEFMAQCLENLEAQTISQQIQVLVIDAASPQNERRIVKDFQKRYSNITYVRTKGRIGIYTAWNLAAQMASGTYCMTVSTNDHLRKDA
ncbi:MAG: glycosyltransferase, partial [Thermodesulfobacteriota bacterium]|nr:glycosyltransferase [Thermodesulfobacteriota bacterium]